MRPATLAPENLYHAQKIILVKSPGKDQLGIDVGTPQPGDVAKVHMTASYLAEEPLFKIGRRQIGAKPRTKEFLSTHIVGDTAFFDFPIPKEPKAPTSATDILGQWVQGMPLGEHALFTFDFTEMDEKIKSFFLNKKLHKGQYKNIPAEAQRLTFEIDSFRIVRNKVHVRPSRYGTGASTPGSFAMG
mmetsp:Transcript_26507/g.58105  ORF Transcript_26507/g.58105 Transcript_26507/m.58105 type:complete len:187 (+) Transcript_26507:99-659(+)